MIWAIIFTQMAIDTKANETTMKSQVLNSLLFCSLLKALGNLHTAIAKNTMKGSGCMIKSMAQAHITLPMVTFLLGIGIMVLRSDTE